jgi:hypothetical protein
MNNPLIHYSYRRSLVSKQSSNPCASSGVCPAGKAIADIPTGTNKAHALAECSNRGRCNRQSGQCQCFPPFTGAACEKSEWIKLRAFYAALAAVLLVR